MAMVISSFSIRRLSELTPGELFIYTPEAEPTLCLLLEREEGDASVFGVLRGAGFKPFEARTTFETGMVISYGIDWQVQVEATASTRYVSAPPHRREAGNLVISETACTLEFVEYQGEMHSDWLAFDLNKRRVGKAHRGGTGFAWSIWATDDDRHRPSAKPIFSFTPQPGRTE